MEAMGMTVEKRDLGEDPVYPGEGVKLPPVILASLGTDPKKKTVSTKWNQSVAHAYQQ